MLLQAQAVRVQAMQGNQSVRTAVQSLIAGTRALYPTALGKAIDVLGRDPLGRQLREVFTVPRKRKVTIARTNRFDPQLGIDLFLRAIDTGQILRANRGGQNSMASALKYPVSTQQADTCSSKPDSCL